MGHDLQASSLKPQALLVKTKIEVWSKERYRASAAERRRYGGATITIFWVHRAEDAKDASRWVTVTGYGKTPGERKTDARRQGILALRAKGVEVVE